MYVCEREQDKTEMPSGGGKGDQETTAMKTTLCT